MQGRRVCLAGTVALVGAHPPNHDRPGQEPVDLGERLGEGLPGRREGRWLVRVCSSFLLLTSLRALRSNGDFEQYWRFHLNNELHQVHQARYADVTIPADA